MTVNIISTLADRVPSGNLSVTTVTTDYTLDEDDNIVLVDATSGNITITLPDATAMVRRGIYYIKKIDSTANTVTIVGV